MPKQKQVRQSDLRKSNVALEQALKERQEISQMLIQKDLKLSEAKDMLNLQVRRLKVMQLITNKIRAMDQQDQILNTIVQGLVLELRFSAALVLLGVPPFRVGAVSSYKPISHNGVRHHDLVKQAYEGSAFMLRDFKHADRSEKELGRLLKLTSFALIPIQVRGEYYGVLICGLNDSYQVLGEEDSEFLEIVANTIAVSLEGVATEERQRAIDALKSEFVSIASHQLRTPLSVVKWILKMVLEGDLNSKDKKQKTEFIKRAYESNEQMIRLVNDLLNVSRIEAGRMGYQFDRMDLATLIREVVDQHTLLAEKKGVRLRVAGVRVKGEFVLKADRNKLSVVFSNIIDNAVKFTPRGGIVTVRLEKKRSGELVVRIADTGIGINKKDQQKLFTKFFRSDKAKRMQTEGSGLGLFIVKNIVEKHNGTITIKSSPGEGTRVTVTLSS